MLVLKRRELRTDQESARVVPPATISKVLLGDDVPTPTPPRPWTARMMLPGSLQMIPQKGAGAPGRNLIEPPEPGSSLLPPPAPAISVISPPAPASWELLPPSPALSQIPAPIPPFALFTPPVPP